MSEPEGEASAGPEVSARMVGMLRLFYTGGRPPAEERFLDELEPEAWIPLERFRPVYEAYVARDPDRARWQMKALAYVFRDRLRAEGVRTPHQALAALGALYAETTRGEGAGCGYRVLARGRGWALLEKESWGDCEAAHGTLEGAVQGFGGRRVRVSHPRCRRRGARRCLFEIRWREAEAPRAAPPAPAPVRAAELDFGDYVRRQVGHLIGVLQAAASGDPSVEARRERDDELGMLAVGINMAMDDLREREAVEAELRAELRRKVEAAESARAALAEQEARFRALAEHALEIVAELDAEGRYLYVSPSVRELLGYEPSALLGTTPEPIIHPEDLEGTVARFEGAVRSGGTSQSVHRLRHADGSFRWFENTGRAYRTAAGEMRFVSVARDVTERVALEEALARSRALLVQREKMTGLAQLVGGVAHEMNTPVGVLYAGADLLGASVERLERASGPTERAEAAERARRLLGRLREAARRTRGLVSELRTFARADDGGPVRVNLHAGLEAALTLLGARAESGGIRLERAYEALPPVECRAGELHQAFYALVANACDALEPRGGGTVRVETSLVAAGPEEGGEAAPARIRVTVRDDGPGVPEAIRSRIFDPFFTTKPVGAGTGLGLAIAWQVARRHGGELRLEQPPEGGAAFHLEVPLAPPSGAGAGAEAPADPEADAAYTSPGAAGAEGGTATQRDPGRPACAEPASSASGSGEAPSSAGSPPRSSTRSPGPRAR